MSSATGLLLERLGRARGALSLRSAGSIAATLGALSRRWLVRGDKFRREAIRHLDRSGFEPKMGEAILDALFSELTASKLTALLRAELGDPRVLDGFWPVSGRRAARARGPRLIFHVFSANVPNPAVTSFIFGLLVKSANAGRVSSRDPGFLSVWLDSLRAKDRALAAACAVVGASETPMFLAAADRVVAYGSDETLAKLRAAMPAHTPLSRYGHRLSVSYVSKSSANPRVARALAHDAWLLDQRGCLSPAAMYVGRGGRLSPDAFAATLAAEVGRLHGASGGGRALAFEPLRQIYWVCRAAGAPALLWESRPAGRWGVLYDERPLDPPLLCGPGAIQVKAVASEVEFLRAIAPIGRFLSAAAIEAPHLERSRLAERLSMMGASRICRAGRLQRPPLLRHHDGRPNLSDWVTWTDRED